MTSSSSATHGLFDRPELLDSQTRLILSADGKPRRLIRSAARSAGLLAGRDRSNSVASTSAIQEVDDDPLDETNYDDVDDDDSTRHGLTEPKEINYDTDIEQEHESGRDYSCKGLYLDQCRRHGVIPSTYFLQHIGNDTLSIRYSGLKPINIKVMVPSLKINTSITKLDLRDNGLGSRGAVYIAQLLKENEYIVELNLADNDIGLQGRLPLSVCKNDSFFVDVRLRRLIESIGEVNWAEDFFFLRVVTLLLFSAGCKALCQVLRTNRTIRRINLDGNRFGDDCAPFMAELLSQNDYIQYINLNKNFFENDTSGRLLGQALAENQTIEEFHFAWNRLRSKASGYFIKPLVSNARLTLLDLSWNGAGLFAAKALMDVLRKNSTLEKLYLNHNQFNTECATHIGKGLAKNETLKYLTLHGNPLESSGCYAVIRPMLKQPNSPLKFVDFRGIIVNRDFLDLVGELSAILPQLKVKLGRERERENGEYK